MPGGEMVEPPKGAKTTPKSEMPGADMNVPVAEETAGAEAATARKATRKPAARKTASAKRKTGGGK